MNTFKIPRHVAQIIQIIEAAGFEAFLVGGCVRDMFLRRIPSDWDIASSASPQEIMRIFEKTVPTGIRYGTVTVIYGGGKAEVTAYRSESGYCDYRRPSEVSFCGDIKTDLSRRDFTINAMAFNPSNGLIDPFDGCRDLSRHLIRAVGDPALRFEEDALRILRAYRFAAQLGFEVEAKTLAAVREKAGLVAKISGERIKSELDRILMSEQPQMSLTLACDGVFDFLGIGSNETVKKSGCCLGLALTPQVLAARWAAFFYVLNKHDVCPEDARHVMEDLRFDTQTKNETLSFLSELLREQLPEQLLTQKFTLRNSVKIKKRLSTGFTPYQYEVYLKLYSALTDCDMSDSLAELHRITVHGEPYSLRMLAISGNDIIELGASPGPACGHLLMALLDMVIKDPSLNDKKTLICLAKQALEVH